MGGRGSSGSGKVTSGVYESPKYASQHREIVDYVMHQSGVDLNQYRNGDGSSPYTTSYWDKNGPKVAINLKGMTRTDRQELMRLTNNTRVVVETGGGWIGYVHLKNK